LISLPLQIFHDDALDIILLQMRLHGLAMYEWYVLYKEYEKHSYIIILEIFDFEMRLEYHLIERLVGR